MPPLAWALLCLMVCQWSAPSSGNMEFVCPSGNGWLFMPTTDNVTVDAAESLCLSKHAKLPDDDVCIGKLAAKVSPSLGYRPRIWRHSTAPSGEKLSATDSTKNSQDLKQHVACFTDLGVNGCVADKDCPSDYKCLKAVKHGVKNSCASNLFPSVFDVDECTSGTHTCASDQNATCANTLGSYQCLCSSGYTWTGSKCSDVDECTSLKHACLNKVKCINTEGSYSCECPTSQTWNGRMCSAFTPCAGVQYEYRLLIMPGINAFDHAWHHCKTHFPGSWLAAPQNQDEMNCLYKMEPQYLTTVMIGIKRVNGIWINYETKTEQTYFNWQLVPPWNRQRVCAISSIGSPFQRDFSNYWFTTPCHGQRVKGFFCQRKVTPYCQPPTLSNGQVNVRNGMARFTCNSGYKLVGVSVSFCVYTVTHTWLFDRSCFYQHTTGQHNTNFTYRLLRPLANADQAKQDCEAVGLRLPSLQYDWSMVSNLLNSYSFELSVLGLQAVRYTFGLDKDDNIVKIDKDQPDRLLALDSATKKVYDQTATYFCTLPNAKRTCVRPANPANGSYGTGTFTATQTLTLTCASGYQLFNSATATCEADGQVTGANGTCARSCTRPSNPSNGAYRTGDFNSVQNTLRLTCNSGYQLYNSSTATCDSDGQVSGANGTCHATCGHDGICTRYEACINGKCVGCHTHPPAYTGTCSPPCRKGQHCVGSDDCRHVIAVPREELPSTVSGGHLLLTVEELYSHHRVSKYPDYAFRKVNDNDYSLPAGEFCHFIQKRVHYLYYRFRIDRMFRDEKHHEYAETVKVGFLGADPPPAGSQVDVFPDSVNTKLSDYPFVRVRWPNVTVNLPCVALRSGVAPAVEIEVAYSAYGKQVAAHKLTAANGSCPQDTYTLRPREAGQYSYKFRAVAPVPTVFSADFQFFVPFDQGPETCDEIANETCRAQYRDCVMEKGASVCVHRHNILCKAEKEGRKLACDAGYTAFYDFIPCPYHSGTRSLRLQTCEKTTGLRGNELCWPTVKSLKVANQKYSYPGAIAFCAKHNATLLSHKAFDAGCARRILLHLPKAWVYQGAQRIGSQDTDRQVSLVDELLTVICELTPTDCRINAHVSIMCKSQWKLCVIENGHPVCKPDLRNFDIFRLTPTFIAAVRKATSDDLTYDEILRQCTAIDMHMVTFTDVQLVNSMQSSPLVTKLQADFYPDSYKGLTLKNRKAARILPNGTLYEEGLLPGETGTLLCRTPTPAAG
eukprot:scpid22393/ scgid1136/ Pro-epidermal growth factor; Epidermal growth factor